MIAFDYTNQNHIIFLLLTVIIVTLLFLLIRYKVIEYFNKRKVKKRFERGNKLELNAKAFLQNKGYDVVDYQSTYDHKYKVDGVENTATIQPDYIVKKKGKTYIVEVKSGTTAISARNRHTRRQLLEYDYVIENDGIFLLDMENQDLQFIQFKSKTEKSSHTLIKVTIVLALVGVLVPYWPVKIALSVILVLIFWKQSF